MLTDDSAGLTSMLFCLAKDTDGERRTKRKRQRERKRERWKESQRGRYECKEREPIKYKIKMNDKKTSKSFLYIAYLTHIIGHNKERPRVQGIKMQPVK